MHQGRSVFSQVMDYFPERDFQSIVERYEGNKWVQSFTCRSHFNVMAFAQLTGRESLRDIETCLAANSRHLHHMGIQSGVSRNNLAHANETRDWRIYRDVALLLIGRARQLYAGELLDVDLNNAVYAFDSTTVELCLTLFLGQSSGRPRPESRCTRQWTCGGVSRRSSASPTRNSTTSTPWTRSLSSRARII